MKARIRRMSDVILDVLGSEVFQSFAVKLGLFVAFGFIMNLVKNEAVCYMVLVAIVLVFCFKVQVEER